MDWILGNLFSYLDWMTYTYGRMTPYDFLLFYLSFLVIDAPRYVLSKLVMVCHDVAVAIHDRFSAADDSPSPEDLYVQSTFAPKVTIACPGKNERETMPATIDSLLKQDYPNFEILVIDDGSDDNTWDAISVYRDNPRVRLYRRQIAGGKSSAVNMAVSLSRSSDIIVVVDADSAYETNALTEIVKPFVDPRVGGVSGDIRVRNWSKNLITRFQACDYLHSISLGRRFTSWIGTLTVCSGAFGAFRRVAAEAVGGWDVGPGEDGDLTLKIRKIGYQIRFAPKAVCFTDVPTTWKGWWKQRRRWNRGLIRYKVRKHVDMAIPASASYSFTNMLAIFDVFFFRIFCAYSFFIYFVGMLIFDPAIFPIVFLMTFTAFFVSNLMVLAIQLYYSEHMLEDLEILTASLIIYPYQFAQKLVRLISMTEEFFLRRSYQDPYIPRRVGDATIHW